jgi:hypothetical protein
MLRVVQDQGGAQPLQGTSPRTLQWCGCAARVVAYTRPSDSRRLRNNSHSESSTLSSVACSWVRVPSTFTDTHD